MVENVNKNRRARPKNPTHIKIYMATTMPTEATLKGVNMLSLEAWIVIVVSLAIMALLFIAGAPPAP
jgi:hypothetical protein